MTTAGFAADRTKTSCMLFCSVSSEQLEWGVFSREDLVQRTTSCEGPAFPLAKLEEEAVARTLELPCAGLPSAKWTIIFLYCICRGKNDLL